MSSPLKRGFRAYASRSNYAPFVSGYLAALAAIERTGLQPMDRDLQREHAAREFERIYIRHEPPETKAQMDARIEQFLSRGREGLGE